MEELIYIAKESKVSIGNTSRKIEEIMHTFSLHLLRPQTQDHLLPLRPNHHHLAFDE
jgi:hypothetical protein